MQWILIWRINNNNKKPVKLWNKKPTKGINPSGGKKSNDENKILKVFLRFRFISYLAINKYNLSQFFN